MANASLRADAPGTTAPALVPVFTGTLNSQSVQLCDARTLHTFMGVLRNFSNWIKGRIRKFGFVEGVDFIVVSRPPELANGVFPKFGENLVPQNGGIKTEFGAPVLAHQTRGGNRKEMIDYHLTLDMAKELAMVENNDKGREARRYFIACERRALEALAVAPGRPALDYARITPAQAQTLKELVQAVVASGTQNHAETWARLHSKFRVNSYLALPAAQFEPACDYLRAKCVPVNIHALPAPTSIDVRALLLEGQSDPVPLTPAQQALINARAWVLAGEAFELARQHLARRVAFQAVSGVPRRVNVARAEQVISEGTLGTALAHEYHTQIDQLLSTARVFKLLAGNTFDALQALAAKQAGQGAAEHPLK